MVVYTDKPKHFDSKLKVVGCFVECDDQFLLLERQNNVSESGLYGIPAGKVESSDTSLENAMIRELQEETGIGLSVNKPSFFRTVYVQNDMYASQFNLFYLVLVEKPKIVLSPKEHNSYEWISTSQYTELPLMEDLRPCIDLRYAE